MTHGSRLARGKSPKNELQIASQWKCFSLAKKCAEVKENEWEISWYKLPHLLDGRTLRLVVVSEGRGREQRTARRKNIFNINAHIYKGFNKWIKFICTWGKTAHEKQQLAREKFILQEKVEMTFQHIVHDCWITINDAIESGKLLDCGANCVIVMCLSSSLFQGCRRRKQAKETENSPLSDNGFANPTPLAQPPPTFPSTSFRNIFHFLLYFFWHIFLRCLHILCIKEKNQVAEAHHAGEEKKQAQKGKLLVWDIFQG